MISSSPHNLKVVFKLHIWKEFDLGTQDDMEREVDAYMRRKFEAAIKEIDLVAKEDLDLKNHLSGLKQKLLKVCKPAAEDVSQ